MRRLFFAVGLVFVVFFKETTAIGDVFGSGALETQYNRQSSILEQRIETIIGPNTLDCGQLGVGASEQALIKALQCGLAAARQGKAFRIIKLGQSIDSVVMHGLLGKPDGGILRFFYDSDVSGGLLRIPRFTTKPCPSPKVRGLTFECS